ncbi:hypothetical protein [Nocardiopsis alborubida]|uniref:Uncharacterized protein n=1 Tax=Nocardiopsis alborubida TaxID=146802 RepID=A0A7X6RNW0_9ACTN|nr:hypothetical protein [Nocardiopsis alborubida]NKY97195.1 hypothetical protein [Nocardiopsis alborubida]
MRSLRRHQLMRALVSGCVATAAYTAASSLLRHRHGGAHAGEGAAAPVDRPAAVAAELTGGREPRRERRVLVDTAVHWGYGIMCGLARPLLENGEVRGWRADAAHLAVVWLPWRALLVVRDLRRGTPLPEPRVLTRELVKHGVYVLVAGRVYDLLDRDTDAPGG